MYGEREKRKEMDYFYIISAIMYNCCSFVPAKAKCNYLKTYDKTIISDVMADKKENVVLIATGFT